MLTKFYLPAGTGISRKLAATYANLPSSQKDKWFTKQMSPNIGPALAAVYSSDLGNYFSMASQKSVDEVCEAIAKNDTLAAQFQSPYFRTPLVLRDGKLNPEIWSMTPQKLEEERLACRSENQPTPQIKKFIESGRHPPTHDQFGGTTDKVQFYNIEHCAEGNNTPRERDIYDKGHVLYLVDTSKVPLQKAQAYYPTLFGRSEQGVATLAGTTRGDDNTILLRDDDQHIFSTVVAAMAMQDFLALNAVSEELYHTSLAKQSVPEFLAEIGEKHFKLKGEALEKYIKAETPFLYDLMSRAQAVLLNNEPSGALTEKAGKAFQADKEAVLAMAEHFPNLQKTEQVTLHLQGEPDQSAAPSVNK